MSKKCYCQTLHKTYETHANTRTCPLCEKEPVIDLLYLNRGDIKEINRLTKEWEKQWPNKKCKYCNKPLSKYNPDGTRMKAYTYSQLSFCNQKCSKAYLKANHQSKLDKCKIKYCKICGDPIPKDGFFYCQYIKRSICKKKDCLQEVRSEKAKQWSFCYQSAPVEKTKEQKELERKFWEIDQKY